MLLSRMYQNHKDRIQNDHQLFAEPSPCIFVRISLYLCHDVNAQILF